MNSYTLHERINRPLEFAGLQAHYISYGAIGSVSLLLLFTLLYLLGLGALLCLVLTAGLGLGLWLSVSRLSSRYGPYGLVKKKMYQRLPRAIRVYSTHDVRLIKDPWKKS